MKPSIPYSVLDLVWIPQGSTPAEALNKSREQAQHVERLGYYRYWVAEHHNLPVASCSTAVILSHVGAATATIRIGSGGIMLPNHAPLLIAEQFGTLDAFYPGRVDLGLGRAPGTDGPAMRALRRDPRTSADSFPQDVQELQAYFLPVQPGQRIRAVPAAGHNVPIWILGSGVYGAQVAAALGLPFAFGLHFPSDALLPALQMYRQGFRPTEHLQKPHVMICTMAIAADTDEHARYLATSAQQEFLSMHRGKPQSIMPPIRNFEAMCDADELAGVDYVMRNACVGARDTITRQLCDLLQLTRANELMFGAPIYDHHEKLYSYEVVAKACEALSAS